MTLLSVASTLKLSQASTIPCVGFGVYESGLGKETQDAVQWALKVIAWHGFNAHDVVT
jgi:diketogulonate reductase-like aldo/keto reductase